MENNMNFNKERMLVGLFNNRETAEKAYEDLKDIGYTSDEINVVMASNTRDKYFAEEREKDSESEVGNKAWEGAGTGSAIGGTIGGIAGVIAALGTNLLIPGLGLVVLGPLAAGLAGAGAGGLTGGIIGALIGSGIPEDKARIFDEGLKNGKILISVKLHNDDDSVDLTRKWSAYHAEELYY